MEQRRLGRGPRARCDERSCASRIRYEQDRGRGQAHHASRRSSGSRASRRLEPGPVRVGTRALGHGRSWQTRGGRHEGHRHTEDQVPEPFRRSRRPCSPSAPRTYFDLPSAARHFPARFMLYVGDVKPTARRTAPPSPTWTAPAGCRRAARDQSALLPAHRDLRPGDGVPSSSTRRSISGASPSSTRRPRPTTLLEERDDVLVLATASSRRATERRSRHAYDRRPGQSPGIAVSSCSSSGSSKWWWLTPMILALLVVAALVIFAQSSAIAPFIYTLF